ncbi:hypothetical protein AB6A40_001315 [Gnathostoma spinigerum]|uniref:Beta-lactamase-related domain-containing protein n=1 Tax=Gnathostoma spinigerum TaxID=75299 RepID=A0ABD6EB15_9BILA
MKISPNSCTYIRVALVERPDVRTFERWVDHRVVSMESLKLTMSFSSEKNGIFCMCWMPKRLIYGSAIYFTLWTIFSTIMMFNYGTWQPIQGFYDEKYRAVVDAFKWNFKYGYEREGANLAIYHHGKMVVNVWNGYADAQSGRSWKAETKTVIFSATKALAALCVAVLVDRGQLSYDDRVVQYWPDYGKYGKENTTIEDILTHKAGLPYIDGISREDAAVLERVLHKIQDAEPAWVPGTATGYHAVSFGWLVDGIVRGADEKHRDVRTFFDEEIAQKYGINVSVGLLDKAELHWIARSTQPGIIEYIRDTLNDPRMIVMLLMMFGQSSTSLANKMQSSTPWMQMNFDTVSFNDPEMLELNMAAVTGIGNAASLAKLFALMLDGTLISNQTLRKVSQPTVNGWLDFDKVIYYPLAKGHGFMFERPTSFQNNYVFGHPGYGGQSIHVDKDNELVVAYVTNGLKTGSGEMCATYSRILRTIYSSLS